MSLSEHESDKFADCSEEHQHVICSLGLIPQAQLFVFCESLCDPLRNFVLVDESRLIILLRRLVESHSELCLMDFILSKD